MKNRAQGLLLGLVLGLMTAAGLSFASTVSLPFTFSANTTARAGEVNANFAAVKASVDDTQAQVTALAGKVATLEGKGGAPRVVDAQGKTVGPYFLYPSTYPSPAYQAADRSLWKIDFGSGELSAAGFYQPWILYTGANCSGTGYYQLGCNGCGSRDPIYNGVLYAYNFTSPSYRAVKGPLTQSVAVASWKDFATNKCTAGTFFEASYGPYIAIANAPSVSMPTVTWTPPLGIEF